MICQQGAHPRQVRAQVRAHSRQVRAQVRAYSRQGQILLPDKLTFSIIWTHFRTSFELKCFSIVNILDVFTPIASFYCFATSRAVLVQVFASGFSSFCG